MKLVINVSLRLSPPSWWDINWSKTNWIVITWGNGNLNNVFWENDKMLGINEEIWKSMYTSTRIPPELWKFLQIPVPVLLRTLSNWTNVFLCIWALLRPIRISSFRWRNSTSSLIKSYFSSRLFCEGKSTSDAGVSIPGEMKCMAGIVHNEIMRPCCFNETLTGPRYSEVFQNLSIPQLNRRYQIELMVAARWYAPELF